MPVPAHGLRKTHDVFVRYWYLTIIVQPELYRSTTVHFNWLIPPTARGEYTPHCECTGFPSVPFPVPPRPAVAHKTFYVTLRCRTITVSWSLWLGIRFKNHCARVYWKCGRVLVRPLRPRQKRCSAKVIRGARIINFGFWTAAFASMFGKFANAGFIYTDSYYMYIYIYIYVQCGIGKVSLRASIIRSAWFLIKTKFIW